MVYYPWTLLIATNIIMVFKSFHMVPEDCIEVAFPKLHDFYSIPKVSFPETEDISELNLTTC